jgi:hypothetical protein
MPISFDFTEISLQDYIKIEQFAKSGDSQLFEIAAKYQIEGDPILELSVMQVLTEVPPAINKALQKFALAANPFLEIIDLINKKLDED